MFVKKFFVVISLLIYEGQCDRVKRQNTGAEFEDDAEVFTREICKDKSPGEWFRLEVQTGDCRNVVQCTDAGLQALRCPHGLAFDLLDQACNWKDQVTNCDVKSIKTKPRPLLNTLEPLCEKGHTACGDASCHPTEQFCDGKEDCQDGSDEAACDINSDPNRAGYCESTCRLPDCHCINNPLETPGNRDKNTIPQMIMITFDDAINHNNMGLYLNDIFLPERQNPNGCSIKGTFFLSHKYTNYTAVDEIYRQGHEIALHSISHNHSSSFWSNADTETWTAEFAGMRDIITTFTDVYNQSVLGMRAPYLRVGGNEQFKMMEYEGILYDSTVVAPFNGKAPYWPYSMFHRLPHACHGHTQNCPTRSYPVWEMVMNELDRREEPSTEEYLSGCAMVDSCFSITPTYEQFYNFLEHNFKRFYDTNRAPMGLSFHSAFLKNNLEVLQAFTDWIDEKLATHDDVYFLSMVQVLQWMFTENSSNGGPDIKQSLNDPLWTEPVCVPTGPANCPKGGNNCKLGTTALPGETIHLSTCKQCPGHYPWLYDPQGLGI